MGTQHYTVVNNSTFSERGFCAADDDAAIAKAEEIAAAVGNAVTLYAVLPGRRLSVIALVQAEGVR